MALYVDATTFSTPWRDSGEWARRAQSSAYCSSRICWVEVLVVAWRHWMLKRLPSSLNFI